LNSKIVRTFNPTEPGDTMIQLIRDTEPDEQSPLIIMLDEADIMIRKITEHLIQPHKNIPIMVYDKISFNRFMDDMMFYHNVILIMTSNEPKENIDAIDNSFLRKGRIDESFTL
jgi:Cdc6-like AAA superfamily ATPase